MGNVNTAGAWLLSSRTGEMLGYVCYPVTSRDSSHHRIAVDDRLCASHWAVVSPFPVVPFVYFYQALFQLGNTTCKCFGLISTIQITPISLALFCLVIDLI